ncbi:MAG: acyl-ACP--UDP-N-acetylglucosamine O-acyltransferase [Kiritimatiellae bacterium]|jgi:UDP-N-acetylglucosamine acyltransferase|nr:acyl-ACP--UDP-N-acetylglucosamine O-acyltransferase [Kiritimatiellia bacterium]
MIHETAIIEDGVIIAPDVKIGAFSYIEKDSRIGAGTVIGPRVTILGHTTIGENCTFHANSVIGDLPQDHDFNNNRSYVIIGDNCTMREGVTIHRGTKEETSTVIGNNCMFMAVSHVAHNCKVGNNVILANNTMLGGYVEVGDNVFFGGGSGVHQFVKVGSYSILGAMSVVTKDVPPYSMTMTGLPNVIAGLNAVGIKRSGFTPEERKEIKSLHYTLYHSGLNFTQAKEQIKKEYTSEIALDFLKFLESSTRGLCQAGR